MGLGLFLAGVLADAFGRRFAEFCGDGYLRMDVRSDFVFVKDGEARRDI